MLNAHTVILWLYDYELLHKYECGCSPCPKSWQGLVRSPRILQDPVRSSVILSRYYLGKILAWSFFRSFFILQDASFMVLHTRSWQDPTRSWQDPGMILLGHPMKCLERVLQSCWDVLPRFGQILHDLVCSPTENIVKIYVMLLVHVVATSASLIQGTQDLKSSCQYWYSRCAPVFCHTNLLPDFAAWTNSSTGCEEARIHYPVVKPWGCAMQ